MIVTFYPDFVPRARDALKIDLQNDQASSPFHVLPPEIIADVFISFARSIWANPAPRETITRILLVCQLWKNIALHTPQFWSFVRIATARPRRTLMVHLDRIRAVPIALDMTIGWSGNLEYLHKKKDVFGDVVQPVLARVVELRMHIFDSEDWRRFAPLSTEILLPELAVLTITTGQWTRDTYQYLRGHAYLRVPSLRYLSVDDTFIDAVIRGCPPLQDFRLTRSATKGVDTFDNIVDCIRKYPANSMSIDAVVLSAPPVNDDVPLLSSLQYLRLLRLGEIDALYGAVPSFITTLLQYTELPALEELSLQTCNCVLLSRLIPFSELDTSAPRSYMPSLRTLSVGGVGCWVSRACANVLVRLPRLEVLDASICTPTHSSGRLPLPSTKDFLDGLLAVPDACPDIRSITLLTRDENYAPTWDEPAMRSLTSFVAARCTSRKSFKSLTLTLPASLADSPILDALDALMPSHTTRVFDGTGDEDFPSTVRHTWTRSWIQESSLEAIGFSSLRLDGQSSK